MKDYQVTEIQTAIYFAAALVATDTTFAMIAAVLVLVCFVLACLQRRADRLRAKLDAGKEPR